MFLSGNIKAEIKPDTTIKLLEDVLYDDGEYTYTIPAGYISDGASVPRAMSWLYPKYGEYLKAAVVHDWLITDRLIKNQDIKSNRVDEIFREAMASLEIPKVRQWIMWAGVRIGAIANKHRRKGSLKTLPKLLFVLTLASPLAIPSLAVQGYLTVFSLVSLILPKKHKLTAHKT